MSKNKPYICSVCGKELDGCEAYEYRGSISCHKCFEENIKHRDFERQEIIEEQRNKTDKFRGLDLTNSQIGKANKQILKADIEIAKKESMRMRNYEGGK